MFKFFGSRLKSEIGKVVLDNVFWCSYTLIYAFLD